MMHPYSYPMDARLHISRTGLLTLLSVSAFFIAFGLCDAQAQTPTSAPIKTAPASSSPSMPQPAEGNASERPLPEINSLIKQVEAHRNAAQKASKDYIYRILDTEQDMDSHGVVKKTTTEEREGFWVNGVYINRLLARDGKPISDDELKKQNERIDQRIAEAKQREEKIAAGDRSKKKEGADSLTFELLLQLGTFSNARRVQLNGRPTIAIDYAGDPRAKTHNLLEEVVRDVAGAIWIDEQDHALARVEGHFVNDFKVGGGLLADVRKGASFQAEWTRVDGEIWLPASSSGRGTARITLFFSHSAVVETHYSDYRKFKTSTTILPGVAEVPSTQEGTEPGQAQP